MNQEIVLIIGAHKSGTTLLRSLLDGHPHLYAIPFETHMFQKMCYWVDNEYRKQIPRNLTKSELIYNFQKWIHTSNRTFDPYADSMVKGLFNEAIFRQQINNINENDNHKQIIEKYFQSIHASLENTTLPENIRVVEKSVENAEFSYRLSNLFPQARFLHIIRNPYSNMVSLRKFKSREKGYPLIWRVIKTLYNNYFHLYKNRINVKNYFVVRYEDLVLDVRTTMEQISQFIEIPFDDILLKPTFRKQTWEGNSTTGRKFKGVDNTLLNRWKKEIHPMEIFYINKNFNFILKEFGYEQLGDRSGFWLPARGENPHRYVLNRLYRYYV